MKKRLAIFILVIFGSALFAILIENNGLLYIIGMLMMAGMILPVAILLLWAIFTLFDC